MIIRNALTKLRTLILCKTVFNPNGFHSNRFCRDHVVIKMIANHNAFFCGTSCKLKSLFKDFLIGFGVSKLCGCSNYIEVLVQAPGLQAFCRSRFLVCDNTEFVSPI